MFLCLYTDYWHLLVWMHGFQALPLESRAQLSCVVGGSCRCVTCNLSFSLSAGCGVIFCCIYWYSSHCSAGGALLFQSHGLDSQKTQPDNMHTLKALQLALGGSTCQMNKCLFLFAYFAAQMFNDNNLEHWQKALYCLYIFTIISRYHHCWSCDPMYIFMLLQSDIFCI